MEITGEMLLAAVAVAVLYFGGYETVKGTKALYHKTQHGVVRMVHHHSKDKK